MADTDDTSETLDALLEEFAARQRSGANPSIEEYAARYPDLADEIRALFPAAAAMEHLKMRSLVPGDAAAGSPPLELGDCRIVRELGRGGMGVVYEAEQVSLGRRVAVKVLLSHLLTDSAHVARFEREARTAASLHHPNIVQVHGFGEQDGLHYFVMERVDGVSLDRVLARLAAPGEAVGAEEGPLAGACRLLGGEGHHRWAAAARIAVQAADALQHAHDHGVLHWDIKPANLLMGPDSHVWVTDFGLARGLGANAMGQPGPAGGTLRFMAPERFRGDVSVRSDVYALGLTLFELMAGRPALADSDPTRLVKRILAHDIADLSRLAPRVPKDLAAIVAEATAADPEARYASAGALGDDLRCYLVGGPVSARRLAWPVKLWRWSRRNPLTAAAAAIALLSVSTAVTASARSYARTRQALVRTELERQKAEASARLTLDVLDAVFARFAPALSPELTWSGVADSSPTSPAVPPVPVLSGDTAALLRDLLPAYDRLARQSGDPRAVRERAAAANQRMGDVLAQLGQYEAAEACYRRVLDAIGDVRSPPTDAPAELGHARVLNRLGRVQTAAGDETGACQSHTQALALLEDLSADLIQLRDVQIEQAWTLFLLGSRFGAKRPPGGRGAGAPPRRGDAGDDGMHLDRAIEVIGGLLRNQPGDADGLFLLALCLRERRNPPAGPKAYDLPRGAPSDAAAILARLAHDHPGRPEYRYELAQTLAAVNLHEAGTAPEGRRQAEEQLVQALDILAALVRRQPYVARFVTVRAQAHYKLAALHRRAGAWSLAEQHCQTAVDELAVLADQSPDQPLFTLWATAYTNALADVIVRQGRTEEGRRLLERNLAALRALPSSGPGLASVSDLVRQTEAQFAALGRGER